MRRSTESSHAEHAPNSPDTDNLFQLFVFLFYFFIAFKSKMDSDNLIAYHSQDQNTIVHTVEASGPQFSIVENKITRLREPKEKYNKLSIVSTTILTLISSITTLYTLFGIIWLGLRLQILTNDLQLMEIDEKLGEIIINKDVQTDSLSLGGKGMKLNQLLSNQVIMSIVNSNHKQQPEIHIDESSIVMQAKSYGSSQNSDYSLLLSKRLNNLQVNEKITNIKLIMSHGTHKHINESDERSNLEIVSKEKLELSGNLGLKVSSSKIEINSFESIYLESKEDSIQVTASDGLRLPNILTKDMDYNDLFTQDGNSKTFNSDSKFSNELLGSLDKKQQLCINLENGRVYKQTTSGFC